MTFSIIIPVYNVENYLRKCVDSVISQTCQDYELILIDNGSTDSSGSICDEYAAKHSNVKVKHVMPNIMAAGARNEGQKMASGDYILFMDSDDFYYDNRVIERLIEKTKEQPDVIVYNTVEFYEKTNKYGTRGNIDIPTEGRSVLEVCKDLIDKDFYSNSAWSKAVKRDILTDNGIEFTRGITVEDNDWYYQVILHVKSIAIVDALLYVYRRRLSGSITTTATIQNTIDCLDTIEKWTKRAEKEKENPNAEIILLNLAKQYCNYVIGYSSMPSDKNCDMRFKDFSYLLQYSNNPRVRIFRSVYKVVGFKGLVTLLKLYKKIR